MYVVELLELYRWGGMEGLEEMLREVLVLVRVV